MTRASVSQVGTYDGPPGSRAGAPTLVVAAAGYGKTSWVEARLATGERSVRADEVGPEELEPGEGRLVVEDLHLLAGADQVALLTPLTRRGPDTAITLTSREPLDPKARSLVTGPVFEVGPTDLSLQTAGVAALLAEEYGLTDPELPSRVHAATAGWATLVHLAADTLARHPADDLVASLGAPESAAATWVESEVLGALPDEVVALLADLAHLDLLTPDLVAHVRGREVSSSVPDTFARLVRVGLLVPHPRAALLGREGHQLVPVVGRVLASGVSETAGDKARLGRATDWYQSHDLPFAAVDAALRAGDRPLAEQLIAAAGPRMVVQGDAAGIVAVLSDATAGGLTPGVRRTFADALNHTGDAYAALSAFAPLVPAGDRDGWDVGLAVRLAAVHFSQGELALARAVLDRVDREALPEQGDGIAWRAARVNVASMLGEEREAVALAAETLRLAERSGAPLDLAAAHQAVAKTSAGSRKSAHLSLALAAARRAGDAVSLARILGNQSYALLAAARCDEAVVVSRQAVQATELVRPRGALTAALHNLAEALSRTGEYAEARWHLRRAAVVSQRIGANRAAASLCGLGDVHRALGQREQGRAAYEEAVRLARASHELQVLVPALAGLARLIVDTAPVSARACAEEAHELATPSLKPYALIALGWVEAVAGDGAQAGRLAEEAAACARADQSLDLLAESLELSAEAAPTPDQAAHALNEALSIWREGGADPDACRIEVLLGRLEGSDRATRARGREAAERLQRLGVTSVNGRTFGNDPMGKDIGIVVLGRFEVAVAGRPVALSAWKSRQARTLVKILAAHQGRPVSRALLCELLWPDDDPLKTSHRLSVLLTTVRTVLDPAKAWPPDHYVASDARGVWLDLRRVGVDADDLLADAEQGAALVAAGDLAAGAEVLAGVDARYRGEAFADEPDEAWATVVREDTRAAWLRSLRHLATVATQQGRSNDASAILTRLLGVDPYDERVHRGLVRNLVRAGRHGEARRAFDRWTEAMHAVDVPPPDPAELGSRPGGRS